MKILASSIPNGSYELRIWIDEAAGGADRGEDIDTMAVIHHVDAETCQIGLTHGTLSNDINVGIALKALELGYKKLTFYRSTGGKASRWATKVKTEHNMDYYEVDLIKQLAVYSEGADS